MPAAVSQEVAHLESHFPDGAFKCGSVHRRGSSAHVLRDQSFALSSYADRFPSHWILTYTFSSRRSEKTDRVGPWADCVLNCSCFWCCVWFRLVERRAFSLVRTSCTVPPDFFLHLTASNGVHCTGGAIKFGSFFLTIMMKFRCFFFVFLLVGAALASSSYAHSLEVDGVCCSSTETCTLPGVSLVTPLIAVHSDRVR